MIPRRTIKSVAQRTGLSVHAIRVWEKRYGAVKPDRDANRRRFYSENDILRLTLLRRATETGMNIGQVARASLPELKRLLRQSEPTTASPATKSERPGRIRQLLDVAMTTVTAMDAKRFQDVLDRAAIELGSPGALLDFVAPLAHEIGARWRSGELSVAQEHFATNLLSVFLNIFARPFAANAAAPHLIIATPCGQHHELGAMLAAACARSHGWSATYFGPSLPIEEFLRAAEILRPRAVGLSIVFPCADRALRADLRKLDRHLPPDCAILIGGSAASEHRRDFTRHRPYLVTKLPQMFQILDRLAGPSAKRRSKSSSRS